MVEISKHYSNDKLFLDEFVLKEPEYVLILEIFSCTKFRKGIRETE